MLHYIFEKYYKNAQCIYLDFQQKNRHFYLIFLCLGFDNAKTVK